ncbi:uncharacterized protein LOC115887552 [Sitophilus oryzae]|uniref:Pectinesterase n=1 Tax=Sitophilus oryzae TaxID=7048 RepID=E7CIQ0_SITOR|nr:uncharacterized protein LOC115887552 [Sitophilus oryzae]ADU33262.1 pectin methylesterase [Sitophilus oryzae]
MGSISNYHLTLVALVVTLHLAISSHQNYPGTETRPILSDDEASKYQEENYFGDWEPEEIIIPDEPDYIVKAGESIQESVNAAIKAGNSSTRKYIKIEAGVYTETVYIAGDVPLTIYGGDSASDVHIIQNISANTHILDYMNLVNPEGARYQEGDPAWDIYRECGHKNGYIGTNCSAVFVVRSDQFQLMRITVENGATDAQAVAVKIDADKVHLMSSNFLGGQDTLFVGANNKTEERVHVHMCYIEGDTDFIFGAASAVFNMCTVKVVGKRGKNTAIIFAPSTPPDRSYGFLVIDSVITGDEVYLGSNKTSLARAWDAGVQTAEDYVAGSSPNGQLVIRDSQIDAIIDVDQPYTAAATSGRPFSTDIKTDRNLDDNVHNRLWEYNNYGDDA